MARINSRKNNKGRQLSNTIELALDPHSEKQLNYIIAGLLFLFGAYHSILYFGHLVTPNSDFPCFLEVAHKLLNFELPTDLKRVPVLGILQVWISKMVHSQHPELTAGWILNAILHPFNIVLLWLVGRKLIGNSAMWFAPIIILNPFTIDVLRSPIVETTFLFFVLITFYFIAKGSRWSYLFASIASMTRYEAAALILAAFVLDVIEHKEFRQRIRAFLCAFAATVPLMLWGLATLIQWKYQEATYYVKEMGVASGGKIIVWEFIESVWYNGFAYLFLPAPNSNYETIEGIWAINKFVVGAFCLFGAVYSVFKRQWLVLAMIIFIIPYIFIHAALAVLVPRYGIPIFWAITFLCVYGFQACWQLINKNNRIPGVIVIVLQFIVLVPMICWALTLVPWLEQSEVLSSRSQSMPYVACGLVAIFLLARAVVLKNKYLLQDITIASLLFVMIFSNQVLLARVIGDGKNDIEFKYLCDWYNANAKDDELLFTSMAGTLQIFDPKHKNNFIHVSAIDANDPVEFTKKAYEKNITYVAWDSRVGLRPKDRYYGIWKVQKIAMLSEPRSVGPYEYLTTITGRNSNEYLYVFKLKR